MGDVVRCPYRGYEAGVSEFKPLKDPWKFGFYTVKMLELPKCYGAFNYCYGTSPRTGRVSEFVIRIKPRGKGGS